MKIEIEYEASWRNSFLDPNTSNNEPLPKKGKKEEGRKFIASSTNLNGKDGSKYYISREITLDTIMGVLNRLIGDQRKLYQARQDKSYYFGNKENRVTFKDNIKVTSNEIVYLRNNNNSFDRNSFTGAIKTNDVLFASDYSKEFWGVLNLEFDELINFILNEEKINTEIELNPICIADKIDQLDKMKVIEKSYNIEKVIEIFNKLYPDIVYVNQQDKVKPIWFYLSSLYLQYERLKNIYDMEDVLTKRGAITGISKKNFTKKQFMERFTTGKMKKIFGNPYVMKTKKRGEGQVTSMLTKANGTLDIIIDIPRDEAKELKKLIDNAGVSSFYLGKKGLAYVTHISTKEVKK